MMRLHKVNKAFHYLGHKVFGYGSSPLTRKDVGSKSVAIGLSSIRSMLLKFRPVCDQPGLGPSATDTTASSPAYTLLGPPEIYLKKGGLGPNAGDPFMDLMLRDFNSEVKRTPTMSYPTTLMKGYTENRSPTFLSSGNPCLDFFFHVVPDTPAQDLTRRLKQAWDQDPLTALKLVCNLRGVRGTGKMDKEGFYSAALWIHKNHPKTLASNALSISQFGYFKDLPEILDRLLKGPNCRVNAVETRATLKRLKQQGRLARKSFSKEELMLLKQNAKSKEERRIEEGKKGIERYNNDPVYRFLHDEVSHLFSEQLKKDMTNVKRGKLYNISFAAKWCPSLYSSFDRSTLLCESIARKIFPRELYPEYEGLEEAHYAYRIRDRFRKEVLVPLRKVLELPEVYMSANRWGLLPYSRVPSIAMKVYTNAFQKHDGTRFEAYLGDVKKGEKKITAGALLPHQVIASLKKRHSDKEVAILQWQRIVDDLSAKGTLKNCLAICDVSGSMAGTPLEVSVALGLLVSESSGEPWKGKLITFSRFPCLQRIEGNNIASKVKCIENMHWEMNTDFQRVFDRILEVAKNGNLLEDQMIKRLFVFSDMEFDEASANNWETDYEAITRKFSKAGYSRVPEIVFWNLRNSKATPVPSHQKGVALVSGFSKNLLKVFLQEGGVLDPQDTMSKAISGEDYDKLVVVD